MWNRIKAWMHKWHVAEWLRAIRRWMADWDAMDENRTLLSPKILSKYINNKIDQYRYAAVIELRNAIALDISHKLIKKLSIVNHHISAMNMTWSMLKEANIHYTIWT